MHLWIFLVHDFDKITVRIGENYQQHFSRQLLSENLLRSLTTRDLHDQENASRTRTHTNIKLESPKNCLQKKLDY